MPSSSWVRKKWMICGTWSNHFCWPCMTTTEVAHHRRPDSIVNPKSDNKFAIRTHFCRLKVRPFITQWNSHIFTVTNQKKFENCSKCLIRNNFRAKITNISVARFARFWDFGWIQGWKNSSLLVFELVGRFLSMCNQLKNWDWQFFSLFAEDQKTEADFQHTRGIYAIYGPNLDLIFFSSSSRSRKEWPWKRVKFLSPLPSNVDHLSKQAYRLVL